MNLTEAFAKALRYTRNRKGLTQEDFSMISSRTYISTLERGLKSPTLEKFEVIAGRLDVHPVTLLVMAYLQDQNVVSLETFLKQIADEVEELTVDNR